MMCYLVVEGETDKAIVEALLPPSLLESTQIIVGQGRSSAESLASTLLSTRGKPVGLLIDADTTDENRIYEVEDTNRWLMGRAAGDTPFEVFVAVPTLEIVLLQDRELLERVLDHTFTDTEWMLGQAQPGPLVLSQLDSDKTKIKLLVQNLSDAEKDVIRQNNLLQQIIAFITDAVPRKVRS